MQQIIFKNLKQSEPVREVVRQRMQSVIDRFPALKDCRIHITLEMHNSRIRARPDLFIVKAYVSKGRYRGVRLEKSGQNLYAALAEVVEHTLEKLNRFGDRQRVKERNRARKIAAWAENKRFRKYSIFIRREL